MTRITRQAFREGAAELARRDVDMARLLEVADLPGLRSRTTGFATMIKIICGQQVSTAAARAINGRLEAVAKPMTPEVFARLTNSELRAIGFSRQKMSYGRTIAKAVLAGDFSFRRVAYMEDEAAIAEMTRLRGVGRWTAEVYLLFALRRPDIWPVDDLGVVGGLQGLKGLKDRPDRATMVEYGKAWRPLRSVAARMLWHYVDCSRRGLI